MRYEFIVTGEKYKHFGSDFKSALLELKESFAIERPSDLMIFPIGKPGEPGRFGVTGRKFQITKGWVESELKSMSA